MAAALLLVAGCGDGGSSASGGSGGSSATAGSGGTTSTGGSGGSGGATSTGGTGGAGGATAPQPGSITVTVEGVTGSNGLILLAGPTGAGDTFSCTPIDADPFSDTEPLHAVTGANPCSLAPEAKVFPPGDYDLFAATFKGGEMAPTMCATFAVTVNGDTAVTAPPFDQWVAGPCF